MPNEDRFPVRISASRGRGGKDRSIRSLNLVRLKQQTQSHQYKKIIWYG